MKTRISINAFNKKKRPNIQNTTNNANHQDLGIGKYTYVNQINITKIKRIQNFLRIEKEKISSRAWLPFEFTLP